ncbi:MAG: tetratricopeptide repeat protein [Woeseiaceae bacterium]|nr:tetratricopeptide repeat protein [Woeseiaceae bacterium]
MLRAACIITLSLYSSVAIAQAVLPSVPESVQAISLLGEELRSGAPSERLLDNLATARANYDNDPNHADNIIWLGRRVAYTGDYRGAIEVFSEGIGKHPTDARMYRHRGHRYISVREFDRAIRDFERAAVLIAETVDEVEPDGAPNPAGIPVSTLHSNIWYHLGLAHYLKGDLDLALRVYEMYRPAMPNDDMLVAFTHWHYMSLRLLGRDDEARAILEPIHEDMNVIESMPYHQLCLLYKGENETGTVLGSNITAAGGDSAMYGISNWHYYSGRHDEARVGFEEIIKKSSWASFGRIAAESDLSRKFP